MSGTDFDAYRLGAIRGHILINSVPFSLAEEITYLMESYPTDWAMLAGQVLASYLTAYAYGDVPPAMTENGALKVDPRVFVSCKTRKSEAIKSRNKTRRTLKSNSTKEGKDPLQGMTEREILDASSTGPCDVPCTDRRTEPTSKGSKTPSKSRNRNTSNEHESRIHQQDEFEDEHEQERSNKESVRDVAHSAALDGASCAPKKSFDLFDFRKMLDANGIALGNDEMRKAYNKYARDGGRQDPYEWVRGYLSEN